MDPDTSGYLGKLFPLLFMMMGPIAVMPGFVMLTQGADAALRRRIAMRAAFYAATSVVLAVLLGFSVLSAWGASAPSLIIAAGLVLLLASLGTLLAPPSPAGPPPSNPPAPPSLSIALSPLAFPIIVTPPAIGILVIFTAYYSGPFQKLSILGTGLLIVLFDLLAMFAGRRVMQWMGMVPLRILGAVFGVLQVALAVELIISGITHSKLMP